MQRDLSIAEPMTISVPAPVPLRATWNADGATIGQTLSGTASDATDFGAFYMRHWPNVLRTMVKRCHNDRELAEDITQATFLVAYRLRERLSEVENHRAWLCAVAGNAASKYFKRRQAEESKIRAMASRAPRASWKGFDIDLRDVLTRVLTDRQQRIITYRYLDDQPLQAIAEMMNLSKRTVNYEIRKSLDLLRPHLDPGQEDS